MKNKGILLLLMCLLLVGCKSEEDRALIEGNTFLVIAHRGASAFAPEHTFPAYDLALDMKADYIELDIQMTKDGKLVTLHDEVLPYGDPAKKVRDYTLSELKELKPGVYFNDMHPAYKKSSYESSEVLQLEEVLEKYKTRANYYIETKHSSHNDHLEEMLVKTLTEKGIVNTHHKLPIVIFESFHEDSLHKLKKLAPDVPLIQLVKIEKGKLLPKKKVEDYQKYAAGIGVNEEAITEDLVHQMNDAGLVIHAYTVNEEERAKELRLMGVSGIFTDHPEIKEHVNKK